MTNRLGVIFIALADEFCKKLTFLQKNKLNYRTCDNFGIFRLIINSIKNERQNIILNNVT